MVKKSKGVEKSRIDGASIQDIISHIRQAESEGAKYISSELTKTLKGSTDKETARNIWQFVRANIRYKEDGSHQRTKSPANLWETRVGDCKSMTVFVASVLQKMCIPYNLIVDFYDSGRPNAGHIYVKTNTGVIIDPVNEKFNASDKAWKQIKIPGHKVCPTVGAKNKKTTMSGTSISSYIQGVGTQIGDKFTVPQNFINYGRLTDGELSVKLVARQNELFYIATGKEEFKQASVDLENVLQNSLNGVTLKTVNQNVRWAQNTIRAKSFPAAGAYYYSRTYQRDRAKMGQLYTFEEYRDIEVNKCHEIRKKWANTGPLAFAKKKRLRAEWESCFASLEYLGVINENLEKSGAHLLYNYAQAGDMTTAIQTKRVLHRIAMENYSRVFGLSHENISLWIRNGIIASNMENGAGAMAPEDTVKFMYNNVTRDYDKIEGAPAIVIIMAVIKVISIALAATQIILARITEVERQKLIANTQGLGTEAFGPEKQDFLTSVQNELSSQGLLIPIGILAAIFFLD